MRAYLHDTFWERRAIAVRYAPQKSLTDLIHDEDEVVRRAVAYRLPQSQLTQLLNDPDREVRMTSLIALPQTNWKNWLMTRTTLLD